MVRQSLIYTAAGPRTFRNLRRNPNGDVIIGISTDEVRIIELDFTSLLDTGETIASATITQSGLSASVSVSSPAITLTITSASNGGTATVTITLSSGEVITQLFRAQNKEQQMSDYQ